MNIPSNTKAKQKWLPQDRIYNANDMYLHKCTENNEVWIKKLKPHFLCEKYNY